jgi:hypothetical protein
MHNTHKNALIYENVFIGAFIYSMGVFSGRNSIKSGSINLFQQTPFDPYVGDVFGSFEGRNFIVEFKKENKLDEGEEQKFLKLEEVLKSHENENKLREISRYAHFFAAGQQSNNIADLEFISYLDLDTYWKAGRRCNIFNGVNNFIHDVHFPLGHFRREWFISSDPKKAKQYLINFARDSIYRFGLKNMDDKILQNHIKNMSDEDFALSVRNNLRQNDEYAVGVNGSDFKQYLELLKKNYESKNKASSACLMVNISGDGQVIFLPAENIEQLILMCSPKEPAQEAEQEVNQGDISKDSSHNDFDPT